MRMLFRWLTAAGLVVTLPVLAQDKGETPKSSEKKPDDKKDAAKKDAPKYKLVSTVTLHVAKVDTKEMTIDVNTGARYPKPVTYTIADDVVVRRVKLPERRDEKGRLQPYTDKEKLELKGKDRTLPGYEAQMSDLKEGQVVLIELSIHRPAPNAASGKKADAEKPFATRIVIQEEPKADPKAKEKK